MRRRDLLLLGFLILQASPLHALDPAAAVTQYVHQVWEIEQGLPQNSVYAIAQTNDGYLWLGTYEGLVRFDGVRFVVFDKRNTPQMRNSYVFALLAARDGSLWIGTYGGGLTHMRNGRLTNFTTRDGLPGDAIQCLFEDRKGNIWIGTKTGLARFSRGRFTSYDGRHGLRGLNISTIVENDGLWIGTDKGLSRYRDGVFTTYTTEHGLADNHVLAAYTARDGALWLGTYGGGLNRFRDGRFTVFNTTHGLSDNVIWSLLEDRSGNLWIGTAAGGLDRYTAGRFQNLSTRNGLSDDYVRSIYEDREGSLWVGTSRGGLNRLKDSSVMNYTVAEGLSHNLVRSVYQGTNGAVWIGTEGGGLNRFEGGAFTHYRTHDGLSSDRVTSVVEDRNGVLWTGTKDGGVNRFAGTRWTAFTRKDGLPSDRVGAVYQDREGYVWIGTVGNQLDRFRDGRFTRIEGGPKEIVVWFHQDRNGTVWIGTDGSGLLRFDRHKLTSLTEKDGLSSNFIRCIYEDDEGTLWIGTRGGGLMRMKDGKFTAIRSEHGLFDDVVFQILEDDQRNFWMSCNRGIWRVSRKALNDFADGKLPRVDGRSFNEADGMKSRECNGGFQPAGWRTVDGRLWFPTIRGVAVIDPRKIRVNPVRPPVVIERVVSEGRDLLASATQSLQPGRKNLEFQYTALSLLAPEKVTFRYKLDGFDERWTDAGTRRTAYYTNVPAGKYTFAVIATNGDGVPSAAADMFSFAIRPFFYQTYWFYLICAAVVGSAAAALYRWRVKQVEARFRVVMQERGRIAREIHDSLAQSLTIIAVQLEVLRESLPTAPAEVRSRLDRLRGIVQSTLADARNAVWNLRPQALESADLVAALSDLAQKVTAGTALRAQVRASGKARSLPGKIEANLLRIGQEAMTNAVRHSRGTRLDVEVQFEPDRVLLHVRDDGVGLHSKHAGTEDDHFGLVGMRERAEELGARLILQNPPGGGTEISVIVPRR